MTNALNNQGTIFVLDDEPQYLDFLFEYLENKGYKIEHAQNIADALRMLEKRTYRFVMADLSVPVPSQLKVVLKAEGEVYEQYPGLYVAHIARDRGYRSRQVVVYSVHDSADVREIADRISVCYITKGRPRILKAEIDGILSYDPTAKL